MFKNSSIFQYKDLLFNLTINELKLKYKNSIIGFLWSFLHPIMLLIVYTFAFKLIIRITIENFPVFVFSGLLPWMFISGSITLCANSLINYQGLIKKVYFPRMIIPLSIIFSNFISMLINFIVLFVALSFFGIKITPALLFVPILLVPTLMLTVGIGLLFSTMTVKYRDISHLTEILFMILFYLTPIIYDLKMIPDPYHDYIQLNPITHIVQMFRTIILDGSIPTIGEFWTSFFYSLLFLLFGGAVFKFREKRLVEEL